MYEARSREVEEMALSVDPSGVAEFAATNAAAAAKISGAGSADSAAMLNAAAVAVGPIGANYLAAYGPAQASNLAATLLVGAVHAAIGGATEASNTSFVATDNA
jgi:hypothetical protein